MTQSARLVHHRWRSRWRATATWATMRPLTCTSAPVIGPAIPP